MKIYLIGMPGSGKSTLGKKLAERLGYDFIDMDIYIELQACMFVDEIFDAYGEAHFRALESNCLKDFLKLDNTVIATGGGIVKNKNNKAFFDGICVYLEADPFVLKERLKTSEIVRPLLQSISVEELYAQRRELYASFADITVNNTDMDEAVSRIIKEVQA